MRLPPSAARPNVVLLLTDDLDAILGTLDYMPNLRRLLVDSGTTFTNAFVTNSLCCPSRTTLQRSQYTHSHRVYTNAPPTGGYAKFISLGHDSSTLAVWLSRSGYSTALLGKYLNGYPGGEPTRVPPGWSKWSSPVAGGYGMFDYSMNEDGTVRRYGHAADDYITDVIGRQAREFVQQAHGAGKPFFLEIATYAPHQPATPAPRHADTLSGLHAPRTPSFDEEDVSDKPTGGSRDRLRPAQIARIDSLYRRRVVSMLAVDEMIADLVRTLSATGELANTYLIFTSDNGFHLGQHRLLQGKTTAYEEDIRVPLIVRGPGVTGGARNDAIVENVDLAPTIAEIAGARVPPFVEGRSLVPLLRGQSPSSWRQVALVESYRGGASDARSARRGQRRQQPAAARDQQARAPLPDTRERPLYIALRGASFTFIEHTNGERELYDLATDPHQLKSLASTADSGVLAALSAWAHSLEQCAAKECRERQERVPQALHDFVSGRRKDAPSH